MDDSGILHYNDKYCVYGGVVFTSTLERDNIFGQYNNEIKKMIYKYHFREVKNYNLSKNDRIKLLNIINKSITYSIIIKNNNIYKSIMDIKKSKGRYKEYAQRIIIKDVFKYLIKMKIIDVYDSIELNIEIDENNMLSNTNRIYVFDIYKEIINMYRYNKNAYIGNLKINLNYVSSKSNTGIQIADLLSGSIRHSKYNNKNIDVNVLRIIP